MKVYMIIDSEKLEKVLALFDREDIPYIKSDLLVNDFPERDFIVQEAEKKKTKMKRRNSYVRPRK